MSTAVLPQASLTWCASSPENEPLPGAALRPSRTTRETQARNTQTNVNTEFFGILASDIDLIFDFATRFNCNEIETIAALLTSYGEAASAECWIDAYATEDELSGKYHERGQIVMH